ncbi:MAG: hypothetical protein IPM40_06170 [Gammaproteobacteria bacterium]|nr:hypothetical protein [Gammaproteobacteria bacterium]
MTDPAEWQSFVAAATAYERGNYDGIGFVVTEQDDFCGIDLDHATNEDGSPRSRRQQFDRFKSYAERTPSGRGFRVWVIGRKPDHVRCKVTNFDQKTLT